MKQKELLRKIYWVSGFLVLFVAAFLVSVFFLNPSSVGNRNFLWNFSLWAVIWALIFILVLSLAIALARNLIRLFFEFQGRRPGSRIKTKLVLTFIIFSLFPALIMFFLAFGLINQNLTKWASAPSEQLLQSSETIANQYYLEKRALILSNARNLAAVLAEDEEISGDGLIQEARRKGFYGVSVVLEDGSVIAEAGFPIEDSVKAEASDVIVEGFHYALRRKVTSQEGVIDRGTVGVVLDSSTGGPDRVMYLAFSVPTSVAFEVERVREANQVYEDLQGTLASLRGTFILILSMTTLALVFGFVWLGNFIAKKLTVPLEALAEGSRELAEGNLDYRVGVQAVDELGILVDSFNKMAAQLKEGRSQIERANLQLKDTNVRLDERRQYIETILQNIATGVITVDESDVIRTANRAALNMLQAIPDEIIGRPIRAVADAKLHSIFKSMKKRARLFGTYRRQVTIERNERPLLVAATMTANPVPLRDETEYLIVLDDLTELIRAEKFAAWQEVARRLAHEIKNPLTPIQLSAERINRRFEKIAKSLPQSEELKEFQKILGEATRIIVVESRMLRNLLAEFSQFARLPACKPTEVGLNDLIEKSLKLFEGALTPVEVRKELDQRIDKVFVDPDQMQRVFVNLLDNSLEAMVEQATDRIVTIRTSFNPQRQSATIEFADTGHGIQADDYEHLFLPYFSTKRKGTGLGLAIVRQVITEHSGFVRAEPNTPQGTKILIEIPVDGSREFFARLSERENHESKTPSS
ncbi:MAG TPA: ATP-binding protein [Acidobacteriota bacterium]|nr:ATP-binding protein [Acidobacteriota bacterium]